MTTISACIITREVDDALRRAVDSVRPLVDEVVIACNSVQPIEAREAATLKARFVHVTSCNATKNCKGPCGCRYGDIVDFSVLRSTAHRAATGDWVTWLDTDDTVEYSDVDLLRKLAARGAPVTARYDYYTNGEGVVETRFDVLRLAPRELSHWYLPIHELLNCPGPYAKIEEMAWKHHRKARGDSDARNYRVCRHWAGDPQYKGNARFSFFCGEAYQAAGDLEGALHHYRSSFTRTTWDEQRYLCAKSLCDLQLKRNEHGDAIHWAYTALQSWPNAPNGYYLLGRAYLESYKRNGLEEHRHVSIRNFEVGFTVKPRYSMLPIGEPDAQLLYLQALGGG